MVMSKQVFWLSAALFVVLSALLYYFVPTSESCLEIDSTGYNRVARYFSETNDLTDPRDPGQVLVQTVGYHLFVGLVYKLFGHQYWPVIWLQIMLSIFSFWLVFLIASHLFSSRVAALSSFLCAINIGFLVYPQFLLAETVVMTMVLAFIERFILFWRSQRMSLLIQSGLIGGLSIIVKPSALLFFFFAAPFVLCCAAMRTRRLSAFFAFTLCFSGPVFGYLTYNKVRYGYFNLAPMKSLNLYHVFLSKVIARVHGISVHEAAQRIPHFSSDNALDERGWEGARQLFWQYALSHPLTCFIVWMKNVSKTLFGLFTTQMKVLLNTCVKGGDVSFFTVNGSIFSRAYQYITKGSPSRLVTVIASLEAIWTFIRYLLVFLAFVALWRARCYAMTLFFGAYFFCFSMITGFDGCGRYRTLFEPMLIVLTAVAILLLYDWMKGARFQLRSCLMVQRGKR